VPVTLHSEMTSRRRVIVSEDEHEIVDVSFKMSLVMTYCNDSYVENAESEELMLCTVL